MDFLSGLNLSDLYKLPANTFGSLGASAAGPVAYDGPAGGGAAGGSDLYKLPANTFGSLGASAAGPVAYDGPAGGGAAGGGAGSWGGMQAFGGIANTLLNQLGNAQGTQAANQALSYMGAQRDADFGSALFDRNLDIADQFRIPRVVAQMRANDPSLRQADRAANLPSLAGKYGQLGGFLA